MYVTIPEELGSKLRVLPRDTYHATIQDMYGGKSKANQPKLTIKWLVTSEYSGFESLSKKEKQEYKTTIGENVLETFSLQPQAIWNLNDLYTDVVGERIPQRDFQTEDEFVNFMKERLLGAEFKIDVDTDSQSGEERSVVMNRVKV